MRVLFSRPYWPELSQIDETMTGSLTHNWYASQKTVYQYYPAGMLRRRLYISNFIYRASCGAKNFVSGIPKITPIWIKRCGIVGLWTVVVVGLELAIEKSFQSVFDLKLKSWRIFRRQAAALSENGCSNISLLKILTFFTFFHIGSLVWFWCSQKPCLKMAAATFLTFLRLELFAL